MSDVLPIESKIVNKDFGVAINDIIGEAFANALGKKLANLGSADIADSAALAVKRVGSAVVNKPSRTDLGRDVGAIFGRVGGGLAAGAAAGAINPSLTVPAAAGGAFVGEKAGAVTGAAIQKDFANGAPVTLALARSGLLGPGMVITGWTIEAVRRVVAKCNKSVEVEIPEENAIDIC